MGDVGSVTLGFLFAAQAVRYSNGIVTLLLISGFLFMFYADALTTLFIRWRDGERLSEAHRRHLYQVCVNQLGMAHWQISSAYGAVQVLISLSLLKTATLGPIPVLVTLGLWFLAFCLVAISIRKYASNHGGLSPCESRRLSKSH